MTDTLVDPPPPPTVRDDALPPPDARPTGRRRAVVIAVALIAPLVLLVAVAATFYVFFWRYEPLARHHVPGNANVVVRIEAADIALFAPVPKHFGPLLFDQAFDDTRPPSTPPKKPSPSLAQRIKDATGVNLATDVREILVASVDATSWVVLLGGRISKGRFVDGIEQIARDDGWTGWRREGPLFVSPPGVRFVVGQADDGTIAVGTDTDVVTASLPATDEWKRMGLPLKGAVTFAATSDAWNGVVGVAAAAVPGGGSLRRVDHVSGQLTLGSKPTLTVRIRPASGQDAAPLAGDVERALAALRLLLLLAPDVAGEKEALAATKVAPSGGDVLITTLWPYEGLDRGCERLAALVRQRQAAASAAGAPGTSGVR